MSITFSQLIKKRIQWNQMTKINLNLLRRRYFSSQVKKEEDAVFFTKENIPYIGLFVGCCALAFQTMVLYPWHDKLSEEFDQLEHDIRRVEKISAQLKHKMDEVIRLEQEVKAKERLVLDSSKEILSKIEQTKEKVEILANSTGY